MGLIRKNDFYINKDVGTFAFCETRLPFRVFSPEPLVVLFQPALSGAGWHKLEIDKLSPEVFTEILNKSDAFSAMSFLRTNGILITN